MSDRPQFGADYIESEFRRVADHVERPLSVYLIGGGAMALRGLKAATKDVDVVVASSESHGRLHRALSEARYAEVVGLSRQYRQLGAKSCVENDDGCRFDVFDRQVANELVLSEGMRARSEPFVEFDDLAVEFLAFEDVFLFKATAGRPGDVDDMNVLVQRGLDFDVVEDELEAQRERLGHPRFATFVTAALGDLEERHGVTLPIGSAVENLAESYYEALHVHDRLDGPTGVGELLSEVDAARDELRRRLSVLEAVDAVTVEDEVVRPLDVGGDEGA